jgi:hypothetical protein
VPATTTTTTTTTTAPATTVPAATTTTQPPAPPPTLPRTGSSGRAVSRIAAALFAAGAFAVLAATPRRRVSGGRAAR